MTIKLVYLPESNFEMYRMVGTLVFGGLNDARRSSKFKVRTMWNPLQALLLPQFENNGFNFIHF
jgi:hypothetical protein